MTTQEMISYASLAITALIAIINALWTWWRANAVAKDLESFRGQQQKAIEQLKAEFVKETERLKSALAVGAKERDALVQIRISLPGVRPTYERLTSDLREFEDEMSQDIAYYDTRSYKADLEAFLGSVIGVPIAQLNEISDKIKKELDDVECGFPTDEDHDYVGRRIHSSVTDINRYLDDLRTLLEKRTTQLEESLHVGLNDPASNPTFKKSES